MSEAPLFPSYTKTFHNKPYPAISLDRPELSAKGKNVIITGGGSGIGAATALAFAQVGASIGLIGRREAKLQSSVAEITAAFPGTIVKYAAADTTSDAETQAAFKSLHESLGPLDILVHAAGYLSAIEPVISTAPNDWWDSFEINVKGTYNAARAFIANASAQPVLLNVSTAVAHLPSMPGYSGYAASKIAAAKVMENLAAESPNVHVVNVQPGVIATDLQRKSGVAAIDERMYLRAVPLS